MKFFLVISIIALWWVPMNSPGNIGMPTFKLSTELSISSDTSYQILGSQNTFSTKRKMDHFGFQSRRYLIKNEID
ncbi:hypothetical protein [Marivirga sp.]|uniref:hypothetical protein n=1 Tax=Marivirga sp. TaxID=2018662 RepID=UPI003DA71EAD